MNEAWCESRRREEGTAKRQTGSQPPAATATWLSRNDWRGRHRLAADPHDAAALTVLLRMLRPLVLSLAASSSCCDWIPSALKGSVTTGCVHFR